MKQPLIYLLADDKEYLVGLSTKPLIEAKFYLVEEVIEEKTVQLYFLTERLPWGVADYLYRQISDQAERAGQAYQRDLGSLFNFFWQVADFQLVLEEKVKKLKQIRKDLELKLEVQQTEIAPAEITTTQLPSREQAQTVYQLLQGRKLYYSELRQLLRENQVAVSKLASSLVYLKVAAKLEVVPSVSYQAGQLSCQRCGSQELVEIECNYCYQQDYYCSQCLLLGEARTCRPLYLIPNETTSLQFKPIQPNLEFELTTLQQDIAQELVDLWYQQYDQAFVWAVCGAGKTEVTFDLLAEALSQGRQVLFAIPRKDVVVELKERLLDSFPQVKIKALYGGTNDRYQQADLVLATTHQLLRYHQAFDLVILDEIDAFPYSGSAMLQRAVSQAIKPEGKLVSMTATPSQEQLTKIQRDKNSKLIKLAARYHGHPLPEPELITADLVYNKEANLVELPPVVRDKLKLSVEGELAQVFVFVPSKQLVKLVTASLRDSFPEIAGNSWVQGSHSEDPLREEKREDFLAGEYPILVSTTIMERGVTVDKANVLVLFADWDFVFSEASLIQMAGRSGRSLEHPEGQVWFIGQEISEEMELAREMICQLNQEAREKGYLKDSV
ncbi:DEAD/DEAH box helicase [Halanaerobaculum tunisiense]